jgi:hypothetical protein
MTGEENVLNGDILREEKPLIINDTRMLIYDPELTGDIYV